MEFYRDKKEVSLNISDGEAKGTVSFQTPFVVDKYLVGFEKFSIGYGKGDHHVKMMGMSLNTEKNGNTVTVSITGRLIDSSGNRIGKGSVLLVIIALPQGAGKAEIPLAALDEFQMEYSGKDHHISGYEIGQDIEGSGRGKAYMRDNSQNVSGGFCHISTIMVPGEIAKKFSEEGYDFICKISVWMDKGDHHLAQTGVEFLNGAAQYDLSDKQGNHASQSKCKAESAGGDKIGKLLDLGNMFGGR